LDDEPKTFDHCLFDFELFLKSPWQSDDWNIATEMLRTLMSLCFCLMHKHFRAVITTEPVESHMNIIHMLSNTNQIRLN
ncbi:unnamed protein product, partial [Haemonchus placei]|uniref:NR LBD domain-containing protein n=1 Tax=Haemonchus placei TaxID=6290 RepID=A0A0N4X4U2_HAEPC